MCALTFYMFQYKDKPAVGNWYEVFYADEDARECRYVVRIIAIQRKRAHMALFSQGWETFLELVSICCSTHFFLVSKRCWMCVPHA
jgi:hypothetical protein